MDKTELLRQFEDTHAAMLDTLRQLDPERVIYEDTGWRVKDIVAHIATWDAETLRSLHAFRRGGAYSIPNFYGTDDFNNFAARARYMEPFEQILSEWEATRNWMLILLRALTPEELTAEMTYPSGKTGLVGDLVQEIPDHEAEHLKPLRAVLERKT